MRHGMTLLELLAVLLLLGLLAGMLGPSLIRRAHSDPQQAARNALQQALERTILRLRDHGGGVIRPAPDGFLVEDAVGRERHALPPGTHCTWTLPAAAQGVLTVDGDGTTHDAELHLAGTGWSCRLHLPGLAGGRLRDAAAAR